MNHPQRGFTLIELMCVLGLIVILALAATPSYRSVVVKGKRAQAHAALMQAMQQQERFFSQHNSYLAYARTDANADGDNGNEAISFIWFSGATAAGSSHQISATSCPGLDIRQCVLLSATPGDAQVDAGFRDDDCGTLTLNSFGERTAAGLPLQTVAAVCQ